MSTKLEDMVDLLAGRKVESALLDELADPSSEASRFLEATRARSKALLAEPGKPVHPRLNLSGRAWIIPSASLAVAASILFAATIWLVDRRFERLEASLNVQHLEARADATRLEATLERLLESKPALRRIEDDLARIEQGLLVKPTSDPELARIRDEVATIRREVTTNEKLAITRAEDLQAAVHDAARLLKLLHNRLDPPPPENESTPGFKPARPPGGGDPRRGKP